MDVNILEEKKNKLVFTITDETHTLCNALRKELWNDDHVKIAGYTLEHPLIKKPKFILETDGADPKKTIQAAVKRLDKTFAKIAQSAKELK